MRIRRVIAAAAISVLLSSCEESKYGDWTYCCRQFYVIKSEASREKILTHVAKDSYFAANHPYTGPKDECSRSAAVEFFTHTHALGDTLIAGSLDTTDYLTIVLDCVSGTDTTEIACTAWASKKAIDKQK